MNITPFYISKLELTGLKTFSQETSLLFGRDEDSISQWTLILGDNGVGKSTLLQCVAWMKPQLPYVEAEDAESELLRPSPLINDEENEILEKLVSKNSEGVFEATIKGFFVTNQKLNVIFDEDKLARCETQMIIGVNESRKLETVNPSLKTDDEATFFKDEVVIYGYSANRQLGYQNLDDPGLLDTIPNFIHERTVLYDAEEILYGLDYKTLALEREGSKEAEKYRTFIDNIKRMLVTVLPDLEEPEQIKILPRKVLHNDPEGGVVIDTKHGKKIPFADFSLGYKTVSSLIIDLAWRLFNKYQEHSTDPLKEPAIVLIDEIDLHLHPIWQREIMQNMSTHFPNVQFIATAHSPLMAQAAVEYNYCVVKHEDDIVYILNEPEGLDGWRVDQILTSELFGLKSARGLRYDQLIAQRNDILSKDPLDESDKVKIDEIDQQLADLPTGENKEDIENRELIAKVAERIKKGDIKLDKK